MKKKLNNIFSNSECISTDEMISFLKGNLSHKENNRIEKHLLACQMCKDEIEGLVEFEKIDGIDKVDEIIFKLNKKIDDRVNHKPAKTIFLKKSYLQIAAVILILISSTFFINNFINFSAKDMQSSESISQNIPVEIEEEEEVEESVITEELAEEEAPTSVEKEFKEKIERTRKTEEAVLESMHDNKIIDNEIETPTIETVDIAEEETEVNQELEEAEEDKDNFSEIAYINAIAFDKNEKKLRSETNKKNLSGNIKTKEAEKTKGVKKERKKIFFSNRKLNKAKTSNKKIVSQAENKQDIADEISSEPSLNSNANRGAGIKDSNIYDNKSQSEFYFKKGLKAYFESNYTTAKKHFKQSLKFKNKANSNYYLALTYLALNNNKIAIDYFNNVLNFNNSKYFDEALWKKANILIETAKRKSAINLLNDIYNRKGKYSNQAKAKLDSMKVN